LTADDVDFADVKKMCSIFCFFVQSGCGIEKQKKTQQVRKRTWLILCVVSEYIGRFAE